MLRIVHYTLASLCIAIFLTVICWAPSAASTGLQILVQPWDPNTPSAQAANSVFDKPTFFDDELSLAWTLARSPICAKLTQALGKPNLAGTGYTLYNIDCTMGSTGTLKILSAYNGLVVGQFDVPGNDFEATSTQNTVFGSSLDPRFDVTYDLGLTVSFTLIPLNVQTASLTVSNATINTKNLAGDVLKALDSFLSTGFITKAEKSIDSTQKLDPAVLNNLLAAASNNQLETLAQQYAFHNVWHTNSRLVVDFAPVFPSSGSSALSGVISWSKASQINIPDCSKITLNDTLQTGPQQLALPYNTFGSVPTATGGSLTIGGAPTDRGDHYECQYSINGLGANLPNTVSGWAAGSMNNAPKYTTASFESLRLQPSGWPGTAVISGQQSGYNFQVVAQRVNLFVNARSQAGPINPGVLRTLPAVDLGLLVTKPGDVQVEQGITAFRAGNTAGALASFNAALAENPGDDTALYNRGLANLKLGNASQGMADLRRAAALARSKQDMLLAGKAEAAIRQFSAPSLPQTQRQ